MFLSLTHEVFITVVCTDGSNTIQNMAYKKLQIPVPVCMKEKPGIMKVPGNLPSWGN